MKFRKKPVVIEAIQWKGDNIVEIRDNKIPAKQTLIIRTLEGDMTAQKGDWIIKGVKGEFYPCKPKIFKMTYEKVEE